MTDSHIHDKDMHDEEETMDEVQPLGTRKRFFGLALAGVTGLVAGRLTSDDEASAATGDPIKAGDTTVALGKTELQTSGPIANNAAFVVDAPNADYGVKGTGAAIGVYGRGPIGVLGEGAVGGVFAGTDTALSLTPTGTSGPSTTESLKGDILVDKDGVVWLCILDGTPGKWIRLSHGGTRPLSVPARPYGSPAGNPLKQGEDRTIPIVGAADGVPAEAVGIVGNLTIFDMLGGGFVTVYPAGSARPPTSSINWNGPAPVPGAAISNAFTVGLGTGGAVTVFADATVAPGTGATGVIVDVTGYIL